MVNFCAIIGCSNRGDTCSNKRFFRLPAVISHQGQVTHDLSKKRREEWIARIHREDVTALSNLSHIRICSDHFMNGEPSALYDNTSPDWIPSLQLGYQSTSITSSSSKASRYERASKRRRVNIPDPVYESNSNSIHVEDDSSSIEVQTSLTVTKLSMIEEKVCSLSAQLAQCNLEVNDLKKRVKECSLDEDSFKNDDEKVKYYTGLCSWQLLMVILNFIKSDLRQHSVLSPFQQLLLSLMKMRLNLAGQDLAYRFCISKSTVSRTFIFVTEVLYVKLKPLILWPSREILYKTMPMDFRKHCPRCAVIIDCFEIFIERPTNLLARSQTFSSYKHHNTVKYLIGITPQGTVCFISDGWGGRVSDKHLTENSGLLNKLLPGDTILADRGFDIQESIGLCAITVKIPAFTKGKPQLSGIEVEQTRRIANVRIHVERVIGNIRQKFTMLSSSQPIEFITITSQSSVTTLDKIVLVSCALINICNSVIPFE